MATPQPATRLSNPVNGVIIWLSNDKSNFTTKLQSKSYGMRWSKVETEPEPEIVGHDIQ
jgi:hypothetical protein